LLATTTDAAAQTKALTPADFKGVVVDNPVQEKAIAASPDASREGAPSLARTAQLNVSFL
jgi:hypothetical protein